MLFTAEMTIREVVATIRHAYTESYGSLDPEVPSIACWAVSTALELIRGSDALYHDVEHTAMVTLVGLELIRGVHIRDGGVSPHDWLQFVVALGCHDIGYVRGVLRGDQRGRYVTGDGTTFVDLDPDGTDALLTPHHVDRGVLFVRQRFGGRPHLDADRIAANIAHTRFPVPQAGDWTGTTGQPAMVRAADLVGQLADPRYLVKLPALYYEFVETGTAKALGLTSPGELRRRYPTFFWTQVRPYVGPALDALRVTTRGQQWVANLQSQVFDVASEADGG